MADHAVVIGIDAYPGMNNLNGPCNDAEKFYDWLIDPKGGNLDPNNIDKKLTRDYPTPTCVDDAHPMLSDLKAIFRPYVKKAALYQHTEGRLFLYLAGHGFADPQDMDSAALFTAEAELLFPIHLAIIDYANFFQRTWAFDEIIVIMDACRSTNPLQEISKAELPRVNPHPNANKVKKFIGYATGFNQVARERKFAGNKVHGIFTMALLDAIDNAKPNRRGLVRGTSIKRHIHNSISNFAGDVEISDPEIDAREEKDVFFVARKASGLDITFKIPATHLNHELIVEFAGIEEVHRVPIHQNNITLPLDPGLYKARIEGTTVSKTFEVPKDDNITF